jgi:hypothetical protein
VSLERGVVSGEYGKRKQGVGIVKRNSKIKKFYHKFKKIIDILNTNFSENLDLSLWIQESLQSSKMKEIW